MICAGVDAGSRALKLVLLEDGRVLARVCADQSDAAEAALARLLDEHGLPRDAVERMVATGYGRNRVHGATTITEITCHAAGVRHLCPDAATVVEIGGQDSKLLRLAANGSVRDFAMNDRCAAGTGRFLEMVAERLGVSLADLGALAAGATPAAISNTCAVFAETEIIGLLAAGTSPAAIAAGVQVAVATRLVAMAGGAVTPPVVFTGGVALMPGMAEALAEALGVPIAVAPDPRFTGALGAALLAGRG